MSRVKYTPSIPAPRLISVGPFSASGSQVTGVQRLIYHLRNRQSFTMKIFYHYNKRTVMLSCAHRNTNNTATHLGVAPLPERVHERRAHASRAGPQVQRRRIFSTGSHCDD